MPGPRAGVIAWGHGSGGQVAGSGIFRVVDEADAHSSPASLTPDMDVVQVLTTYGRGLHHAARDGRTTASPPASLRCFTGRGEHPSPGYSPSLGA